MTSYYEKVSAKSARYRLDPIYVNEGLNSIRLIDRVRNQEVARAFPWDLARLYQYNLTIPQQNWLKQVEEKYKASIPGMKRWEGKVPIYYTYNEDMYHKWENILKEEGYQYYGVGYNNEAANTVGRLKDTHKVAVILHGSEYRINALFKPGRGGGFLSSDRFMIFAKPR